ncbi:MAG TPA: type II secretion system F family protein [Candidatus Marinimicrobia bacterium]|jgi:type IV pilus assembly protein PilC|nr:pilus assembly protein PilC [Candidatus Neomarinimicrobiota bacterium]MDP6143443.1 type II secretion system F family protein [Candidatus Neomarinimicrobiota bacterium]MDP6261085.1 type II secretion system F family protein [Candidatus Neomarinimicrobiota bacterium]MDP7128432.1 type II secretion system F family protein [Candidatus Neomarinimicrobiota bacterium]MDP7336892.1 type II secretion system F family protein [Candidatus Neomarinimicrobiota bacterium]|tara:strand:- start:552 stop:1799 length:1248 start_codon:yes stop_codon:yes gene_type:complete
MAVFQYVLKDTSGNRKEGAIKAATLDTAIQTLTAQDQVIITIKEEDTSWDFLGPFLDEINLSFERLKNRIPLTNLVFFTRQLATMFAAGLTIERSVQGLAADEKHPRLKKVLNKVVQNVRQGLNLSAAFQRHPGVFNNLYIAMIKAGEISGNLDEILDHLATYLENIDDTRRKVRSAMTYPIFMLVFMATMITAMFIWIIPKFSEVYAQLGSKLPKATRTLVALSEWISSNFGSILFFSFIFIVSIWMIAKTRKGGFFIDSLILNLPVFGSLNKQAILNKFCKTFGILVGAGVPVLESTLLLSKVVDNRVYEEATLDASKDIREGYNISTALRRTEVFPSIMLQLTSTGEETGELGDLLDRAADYYYKQVNVLVDRMTTLIEPLLILAVGVVIAIMVVVTYLPVFHLGAALQSGL